MIFFDGPRDDVELEAIVVEAPSATLRDSENVRSVAGEVSVPDALPVSSMPLEASSSPIMKNQNCLFTPEGLFNNAQRGRHRGLIP